MPSAIAREVPQFPRYDGCAFRHAGEPYARVCVVQAECDANRCVYRFPTLAWWDGQLRKKGAFRCEPLPRYGVLPPTKAPVGVNRQLLGRVFVAGLNLWIDADS